MRSQQDSAFSSNTLFYKLQGYNVHFRKNSGLVVCCDVGVTFKNFIFQVAPMTKLRQQFPARVVSLRGNVHFRHRLHQCIVAEGRYLAEIVYKTWGKETVWFTEVIKNTTLYVVYLVAPPKYLFDFYFSLFDFMSHPVLNVYSVGTLVWLLCSLPSLHTRKHTGWAAKARQRINSHLTFLFGKFRTSWPWWGVAFLCICSESPPGELQ